MTTNIPDLERLDRPPGGVPKNNSPNENIVLVQKAQGLISQISEMLCKIIPKTDKQKAIRSIAIEEINLFERTTLNEALNEFE